MLGSSGTYSTSIHTILQFKQGYYMHAFVSLLTSMGHSSLSSVLAKLAGAQFPDHNFAMSHAVLCAGL